MTDIKHPEFRDAADACEKFDEAVHAVDGSRFTVSDLEGPPSGSGPQPSRNRLYPLSHIQYLDIDPDEIDDYREKLKDVLIPKIEKAADKAADACKEFEEEHSGETADKALADMQSKRDELKEQVEVAEQTVKVLKDVREKLDEAAGEAAKGFKSVAKDAKADVEIILTMQSDTDEYKEAKEKILEAARDFDKVAGEAYEGLREIEERINELVPESER